VPGYDDTRTSNKRQKPLGGTEKTEELVLDLSWDSENTGTG
jgi:hypothetical protein